MKCFHFVCIIALQIYFVALSSAIAQDAAAEPSKVAQVIEDALKIDTHRLPWEGIFTQQRALVGRTLYITNGQWADLSDNRHASGTSSSVRDGFLELKESGDIKVASRKFVVVPWSKRVYLVEEDRLIQFVNAVNSGVEPCKESPGAFLVRIDLLSGEVEGKPVLPKNIQHFVFDKPYRGKVTQVFDGRKDVDVISYGRIAAGIEIEVLLDEPKTVFVGMALIAEDSSKSYRAIVTDTLAENSNSIRAIVPNSLILDGKGPAKDDCLATRRIAK